MKENTKKRKRTNARRILKRFSSSRGSSSGSLLFLGGVYRGHLIHLCYTRARFCALLCCVGVSWWFFEKKINGTKTDQDPKSFHCAFFPSGLPHWFFFSGTHTTHLFYLTWITRFDAQTTSNNNDRGRVLRVSQLGSPFVFQPGDGVGSDRWDVVDTHARHGRKRRENLLFV